jgi:hypothetical protein
MSIWLDVSEMPRGYDCGKSNVPESSEESLLELTGL